MEKRSNRSGIFLRIIIVLSLVVVTVNYYYPEYLNSISDKVSQVMVVVNDTDIQYMAMGVNDELSLETVEVPEEADEYAKQICVSMLDSVKGSEALFDVVINNYDNLYLGEPFAIEDIDSESESIEVYYYPICEDNNIKMILSVYNDNNEWNATIGKDIADELNGLSRSGSGEYRLYYSNGTIYAECVGEVEDNDIKESADSDYQEVDTKEPTYSFSSNSIISRGESYRRRPERSSSNFGFGLISNITSLFSGDGNGTSEGQFLLDSADQKIFDMTNCMVGQLDAEGNSRGMCWASSVATIARYMTGDTSISAESVCETMNVGLDDGGDIDLKKRALAEYGLDFTKVNTQLSWSQVKNNIDNNKPIAISSFTGEQGHAVTVVGYSEANGVDSIVFWNSGSQKMQVSTYREEGTMYSYNSYVWTWTATLY